MTKQQTITSRKAEAERIAAEEGYAIANHDDAWQFFSLADDLLITEGPCNGDWCHTFFSWNGWKFEGAVSLTRSNA